MCVFCSYISFFASVTLTLTQSMTLVYQLDLDILKMYLCIKNEVSRSKLSKARALRGKIDRDKQA